MIKKRVFIVCILVATGCLSAFEIEKSSIVEGSYGIQIGAFKNPSNIQRVKEYLSEYELYLEPYKGFKRVQVVNILTRDDFKRIFFFIKKKYPNAFALKRTKITQNSVKKVEHEDDFRQIIKPNTTKIQKFEQYLPILDSNSIIKTRKSFL